MDALSYADRLTMETAKSLREDYLHQDAFHEVDTYASLKKQFMMLKLILECDKYSREALAKDVDLDDILNIGAREMIGRLKYIPETELKKIEQVGKQMRQQLNALSSQD